MTIELKCTSGKMSALASIPSCRMLSVMWVATVSLSTQGHLWPSISGKLLALIHLMWSCLGKHKGDDKLMESDFAMVDAIGKGQNKPRNFHH